MNSGICCGEYYTVINISVDAAPVTDDLAVCALSSNLHAGGGIALVLGVIPTIYTPTLYHFCQVN